MPRGPSTQVDGNGRPGMATTPFPSVHQQWSRPHIKLDPGALRTQGSKAAGAGRPRTHDARARERLAWTRVGGARERLAWTLRKARGVNRALGLGTALESNRQFNGLARLHRHRVSGDPGDHEEWVRGLSNSELRKWERAWSEGYDEYAEYLKSKGIPVPK